MSGTSAVDEILIAAHREGLERAIEVKKKVELIQNGQYALLTAKNLDFISSLCEEEIARTEDKIIRLGGKLKPDTSSPLMNEIRHSMEEDDD